MCVRSLRLKARKVVVLAAMFAVVLSGCGGDNKSGDSVDDVGYLQFYNASPNSSTTKFMLDDELVSSAPYGDVTALTSISTDDYTLTLEHTDTSDASTNTVVLEREISLAKNTYSLWALLGDYSDPTLVQYDYVPEDNFDDDKFEFMLFNFSDSYSQLEIHYVADSGDFEDASFLVALGARAQSEMTPLDYGNYRFFVVDVDTGALLLSTDSIPFSKAKTYFLAIRDDNESTGGSVSLDQFSASTFVYNYASSANDAQVRVYNSVDDLGSIDALFTGRSDSPVIGAVSVDELSAFQSLAYGDYSVDLTDVDNADRVHLQNKLVSLKSGASKNLVVYRTTAGVVSALVFDQDVRERLYEHDINFLSVANKVDSDGNRYLLKAYFVNEDAGETMETAAQAITGIDFAKVRNFTLVAGSYAVYVTYTDDDGVEQSFTDKVSVTLEQNMNYLLVLEPDANKYSGYRLSVLH